MASSKRVLNPGDSTVFTTRVVGQTTILTVIPWPPSPDAFLPTFRWRKILCCEDDHIESSKISADISAAGALVNVSNIDSQQLQVWTDYI